MNNKIYGFILIVLMAAGAVAEPYCQTLRPDPVALAAAASRFEQSVRPGMAAAITQESQLDVIDILIGYDTSAEAWLAANGKGSPDEFAASCIEKMNYVLEQSQLKNEFHFRLAGTVVVPADYSSTAFPDILDRLVTSAGAVAPTPAGRAISSKRTATGADIVSLLVSDGTTGMIGLGYSLDPYTDPVFATNPASIPAFGNWAYNVCSIEAVALDQEYTLLHEIGHNMGAGHPSSSLISSGYMDPGPQLYSYSSGYYLWNGDVGYYTVMAYNFGGRGPNGENDLFWFKALPYFSSPGLTFNGKAVGDAMHDNRQTLLKTCHYVASYRIATLPATPASGDAEPTDYHGVTGAFVPGKAINGVAPYVGVLQNADGVTAGVVSFKVGKANVAKGNAKVSGTITTVDGVKYSIKAVDVPTGTTPQQISNVTVPKLGTLAMTIGGSGFYGKLSAGGREYTLKTAATGALKSSSASFQLDDFDAPDMGAGWSCLPILPQGEPVTATGAKWTLRKAGNLKYKKTKEADGSVVFELTGLDNPAKPNVSALKLSYAAKTSTFKGSFKVYYSNVGSVPAGKSPKLKNLTVNVSGVVVDGVGAGVAVSKKPVGGPWRVSVE